MFEAAFENGVVRGSRLAQFDKRYLDLNGRLDTEPMEWLTRGTEIPRRGEPESRAVRKLDELLHAYPAPVRWPTVSARSVRARLATKSSAACAVP